jgi:hypothetical protein
MQTTLILRSGCEALSALACAGMAFVGIACAGNAGGPVGRPIATTTTMASSTPATDSAPASRSEGDPLPPMPKLPPLVATKVTIAPLKLGARDPRVMALAKTAAACKFEESYFDEECPGYKAWKDDEPLFADGKGDDTLLSMLGDKDAKIRVLAADKGFSDPGKITGNAARARELFAIVQRETVDHVGGMVAYQAARVDVEKFGLQQDLLACGKHALVEVRRNISYAIAFQQGPAALHLTALLLDDASKDRLGREVREQATSNLSMGGITPGTPEVCAMLERQMATAGPIGASALRAAGSSKCPGMLAKAAETLTKRTQDPSKITNHEGVNYTLAVDDVCGRPATTPELKKVGFGVAKKLSQVNEPNTKRGSARVLQKCGEREEAKAALEVLAGDKDKFVADEAKKVLAEMK